jgi:hypothetical protein
MLTLASRVRRGQGYRYDFWRPVTAIRNGEIDENPDTESDAAWQPLDATPMHPEYPWAHCIQSGAAAAAIESSGGLGELMQFRPTSLSAPGVTYVAQHFAPLQKVQRSRS